MASPPRSTTLLFALLRHHLPGSREVRGVSGRTGRGRRYVLTQPDRLLRREGERDVARCVSGDGPEVEQLLALVGAFRVREDLDVEGLVGGTVQFALDGRGACGVLLRGGEEGLVLQVVGSGVEVLEVVGGGPSSPRSMPRPP